MEIGTCLNCRAAYHVHAVAIGELKSEGVADEVQQFVRLGEQLLANVTEACPSVLGGLFWIAQHYDVLPSVGQPLATLLCPTLAVRGRPGCWTGGPVVDSREGLCEKGAQRKVRKVRFSVDPHRWGLKCCPPLTSVLSVVC